METGIRSKSRKEQFEILIQNSHSYLSQLLPLDIKLIRKYNLSPNSLFKVQVINQKRMIMPVTYNQAFSGVIEFNFKSSLSLINIQQVLGLISIKIKPNSLPEVTQTLATTSNSNAKIISLDQYRKNPVKIDQLFNKKSKIHNKLKGPIFVSGSSQEDQRKIALELHYYFKHQLFVTYDDIKKSLKRPSDLSSLEGSTILIEQFQNLDRKNKYFLLDYLTELNKGNEPLLICTSTEIRKVLLDNALDRYLLKLMSQKTVQLKQPFSDIKKSGIQLFLSKALFSPSTPFLKS